MKPRIAPLLVLFAILFVSTTHAQDTVRITGYTPGSRANAVPAVKQALALCKTKGSAVLVFAPGRYDFWPQDSDEKLYYESNTDVIPLRTCPILLHGQHNLTINGMGAEFVFHGIVQPFTIDSSDNITIKNISVDWDIPLTAQGQVMDVNSNYIDIAINTKESPYTIENGKLVFMGEGWKSAFWDAMEFEKDTHLIAFNTADECLGSGWDKYKATELKHGLVRLSYAFKRLPPRAIF